MRTVNWRARAWVAAVAVVAAAGTSTAAASGAGAAPARPAVSVLSISPPAIAVDTPDASLGIIGKGFVDGMSAKLRGTGAVVTSFDFIDPHVIRIGVAVAPDAHPGPRTLVLRTPDGPAKRCIDCVTIVRQPTATGAQFSQIGQGAQQAGFIIHGTGFDRFVSASSTDGVHVYSAGSVEPKTMFVIVNVSRNAPPGPRDVTIENFNYGHTVCIACVTITPAPRLQSVQPSTIEHGASHVVISLTGSGFQPGMVVRSSQLRVHIESIDVTSDTTATMTVSVDSLALHKASNLILTNPDHGTSKAVFALQVD